MIDESLKKKCPEGYICEEGTSTKNNKMKLCPPGFYCPEGTGELGEVEVCDEKYYCDEGTSEKNKHKNMCPEGYFCLKGSFSKLDDDGKLLGIYRLRNFMTYIEEKKLYSQKHGKVYVFDNFTCEEDNKIPLNFITEYYQKNVTAKKNETAQWDELRCPEGTASQFMSSCIGHCKRDKTIENVDVIDPLDDESKKLMVSKRRVILIYSFIKIFLEVRSDN
jgi:hypothetical protein